MPTLNNESKVEIWDVKYLNVLALQKNLDLSIKCNKFDLEEIFSKSRPTKVKYHTWRVIYIWQI